MNRFSQAISAVLGILTLSVPINFAITGPAKAEPVNSCVGYTGVYITNSCSFTISVAFCMEKPNEINSCPGMNQDDIGPGQRTFVGVRGRIYYGACRGRYAIHNSTYSGGTIRFTCD